MKFKIGDHIRYKSGANPQFPRIIVKVGNIDEMGHVVFDPPIKDLTASGTVWISASSSLLESVPHRATKLGKILYK